MSTEVLGYDFSEYPYFTVCAEKNLDESFSLKQTFPLAFNAADGSYTFNDPVQTLAVGYVPEGESSVSVLQSYNNVKLTPATQSTLKPVTPKIYTGADGEMSCYTVTDKYDEFIFTLESIMRKACKLLKSGGMCVMVVGEVRDKQGNYYGFVPDTVKLLQNCKGMGYYNEAVLATPLGTAMFRADNNMIRGKGKLVRVHQNIVMFKKQ